MINETQVPAKHVRPGAEILLPRRLWRVVRAISAPDRLGMIWMTFDGGDRHGVHGDLVVPVRMDEALASLGPRLTLMATDMATAWRPASPRAPLELGRREIFEAMFDADLNLERAARRLDVDRQTLEGWIVAAGTDDFFCPMCFCDKLSWADHCDDCRAAWIVLEVPAGVAPPPIVATHWSRRADPAALAPSRWEEIKAVFVEDCSLDLVARRLGVARQTLEQWIVSDGMTGAFCALCCRDMPSYDEHCGCGASNWIALPVPTRGLPSPSPSSTRTAVLPAHGKAPLDLRILDAVRQAKLRSANAIVNEIGGRRQDVYAIVKTMLGAGRLCVVDGVILATE